VENFDVGMYME